MGKTFDTKNKILNLLRSGPLTPSEIWRELNLAPSTVSQHLKELVVMGKVEEGYDEHLRNIRYYRLTEQVLPVQTTRSQAFRIATGGFGVLLLLALVALYMYSGYHGSGKSPTTTMTQMALASNTPQYRNVQVSMTDPPQVPNGTKAMIMQYTNVQAQILRNGTDPTWVSLSSGGSVDLLSLVNSSLLIGVLNLSSAEEVGSVRLNISNATIQVANYSYPVLFPSGPLEVQINDKAQNGNSTVLLDLTPTITAVYEKGAIKFIMAPSISAVEFRGNVAANASAVAAAKTQLEIPLNSTYKNMLQHEQANITVTSASISSDGNHTSISVTVKDNSDSNVTLSHVLVTGGEALYANLNFSPQSKYLNPNLPDVSGVVQAAGSAASSVSSGGGSSVSSGSSGSSKAGSSVSSELGNANAQQAQNYSVHVFMNLSAIEKLVGAAGFGTSENASVNASAFSTRLSGLNGSLEAISKAGLNASQINALVGASYNITQVIYNQNKFEMLGFLVADNGSLVLLQGQYNFSSYPGYVVRPGQSVTLTYSGSLALNSGQVIAQLQDGAQYKIVVTGDNGAYSQLMVTAS